MDFKPRRTGLGVVKVLMGFLKVGLDLDKIVKARTGRQSPTRSSFNHKDFLKFSNTLARFICALASHPSHLSFTPHDPFLSQDDVSSRPLARETPRIMPLPSLAELHTASLHLFSPLGLLLSSDG